MSDSQRQLAEALSPILKAAGYRKRALNWHRDWADTISVLNLQKSQWGDQFYINCAIYLKALGDEETPPAYRCHIRIRLDDLLPKRSRLHELLDFEKNIKKETRLGEIEELVKSVALPWLEEHAQIERLKSVVRSDEPRNIFIHMAIREHFTPN